MPVRRLVAKILATAALFGATLMAMPTPATALSGPSTVDFGVVPIGSAETLPIVVTVSADMTFHHAVFSSDDGRWGVDASNCVGVSGASCAVYASFRPTSLEPATAELQIYEAAGSSFRQLFVTLTGTGVNVTNGSMAASPESAEPTGSFAAASVTPCPTGSYSVQMFLLDAEGNGLASHPAILGGGGNWAGTVSIPADAPVGPAFMTALCNNQHDVTLQYYNFVPVTISAPPAPPSFSAFPTTLSFGQVRVGESTVKTVTVTNVGGSLLTFSGIAVTTGANAFRLTANNCTGGVAPGASCQTSITFTPTSNGTRTGTLSYSDNAGNSPQTVELTGRGCLILVGSVCL